MNENGKATILIAGPHVADAVLLRLSVEIVTPARVRRNHADPTILNYSHDPQTPQILQFLLTQISLLFPKNLLWVDQINR